MLHPINHKTQNLYSEASSPTRSTSPNQQQGGLFPDKHSVPEYPDYPLLIFIPHSLLPNYNIL